MCEPPRRFPPPWTDLDQNLRDAAVFRRVNAHAIVWLPPSRTPPAGRSRQVAIATVNRRLPSHRSNCAALVTTDRVSRLQLLALSVDFAPSSDFCSWGVQADKPRDPQSLAVDPKATSMAYFAACDYHVAARALGSQKYLESRSTVDSVPIRSKLSLSHWSARALPIL
jgi:hypothetical protein